MTSKKEVTNFSRGRRKFLVAAGVAGSAMALPPTTGAAAGQASKGAPASGSGGRDLLLTDAFVITMAGQGAWPVGSRTSSAVACRVRVQMSVARAWQSLQAAAPA